MVSLGFPILSRAWFGIIFVPPLFCTSHYFYMFATIVMTILFILFMFLVIMFMVYFSYILDIVMIDNEFIHMFAKRLAQDVTGLSGRHYVSMVLIHCLPADTPYILSHVVGQKTSSILNLP